MNRGFGVILTGLALVGCGVAPSHPGATLRTQAAPAVSAPVVHPYSPQIQAHFTQLENDRVAHALLRRDTEPADARFSASRLATTYLQVALREEHAAGSSGPTVLRRWEGPVTYAVQFGASVPEAQRRTDLRMVGDVVSRMAAASGHPMRLSSTSAGANFHVLVLSEGERRNAGPMLRQLIPGIGSTAVDVVTGMGTQTLCLAMAFSRAGGSVYSEAVAVIRAEHPDLTREACFNEELAQGLGLAADSPEARPSVFNDDQEFAILTDLDLLLLRLHFDPRLRPGMTEVQARPIVFSIASTLVAGET